MAQVAFTFFVWCTIILSSASPWGKELHASSTDGYDEIDSASLAAAVREKSIKPENFSVPWESKFNLPPQDPQGWSILTPSQDTKLIYVSEDGDDETGQIYSVSDPEIGDDPQDPIGPILPYKTFFHALSLTTNNQPEWVLFKRGDTFYGGRVTIKPGRSLSERKVITYYGTELERPLIKTGADGAIKFAKQSRFIAVVGLEFYADERDPNSVTFPGFQPGGKPGFESSSSKSDSPIQSVLIEDCVFSFYTNNIIQGTEITEDFIVRRSQILNNYSVVGHAQGLYSKNSSVLVEENLFDHNGWYQQQVESGKSNPADGQATLFNHSTYFSNFRETIFRKNIYTRSSSMGSKFTANPTSTNEVNVVETRDVLVDNNLYIEGELGISAGGNLDYGNGHRWQNINLVNNVMLYIGRDRPTNRQLGWGVEVNDWNGGLIFGNYFLNYGDGVNVKNVWGINLQGDDKDVEISSNVFYNITGNTKERFVLGINSNPKSNITVFNNEIQLLGETNSTLVIADDNPSATSFSYNVYFSESKSAEWMKLNGNFLDFDSWVLESGDIGSRVEKLDYLDPGRTIETYSASLGHEPTLEAFIEEVKKQSKFNWHPEYTAEAVNSYIREGFTTKYSADSDPKNSNF